MRILTPVQSITPKNVRNQPVYKNFHEIYTAQANKASPEFEYDMKNVMTFVQSQRMYKVRYLSWRWAPLLTFLQTLLERYNPLVDLTAEEHIEATARRVGLNMPKTAPSEE